LSEVQEKLTSFLLSLQKVRRSSKTIEKLLDLAYFKQFEFKQSENIVDVILQRISAQPSFNKASSIEVAKQPNALFSYLLKAFFLLIQNQSTKAEPYL
jgi:hypothetical protein